MRIAVDVMGGDHGPAVVVPGALNAARSLGVALALVGREAEVQQELARHRHEALDITVVHAEDVVGMDEHAATAARRKPRSSVAVALREVKEGRADAMVSAGHSGAAMATGLMVLGRVSGIERPALATVLPTRNGRVLVLDLGAVTDPRPSHLVDFALMGSIYAHDVLGISEPSVGLLSNGEEDGKGNQLVNEVNPLLRQLKGIRFHGNIEGNDITQGVVDVVVTDGFTGNITLKVAEGAASLITAAIRQEVTKTWPRKIAAIMLKGAFDGVRKRFDYREYGGAPLLGINGPAIVAHGRSDERAIESAIGVAHQFASGGTIEKFATIAESRRAVVSASGTSTAT
ncbi:MAG TPA: phosphate acyltransferase PlsX [Thermomicrobiales bacterium]|jgi:glycerol-3-phosphate acyltransferase PlsX|nr:phosphate acyltransferase PlsX [Thermomicrobiales bacterium]